MPTYDDETEATIEEALQLLKAGKKREAQAIILPLTLKQPNLPDGWYLLGFTVTELEQKRYCFQQVLQLDPTNEAAQRQLAKLMMNDTASTEASAPAAEPAHPAPMVEDDDKDEDEEQADPDEQDDDEDEEQEDGDSLINAVIAIPAIIILILMAGIGFYIFYGIRANNQVNDLFQQRQCAEVIPYVSFENVFPRNIFSSTFDVYQQVEECQSQQVFENAFNAQDRAAAYDAAKAYLAQYPQGTFADEINEQGGNILLSWSESLLEQDDFDAAIQKLTLIEQDFPGSAASKIAPKTILDDNLDWGFFLLAHKDYARAEKILKMVTSDAGASLEQSKLANDSLVLLYTAWGEADEKSGQYEQALLHYENARLLNPTLINYEQRRAEISLKQATALADAQDFDRALATVDGLLARNPADQLKFNAQTLHNKILNMYSNANSAQAKAQMAAATTNLCQEQLTPTLPIFGTSAQPTRFVVQPAFHFELSNDLLAQTPSEFHYAICVQQTYTTIESCEYQRGYVAERNYYIWDISIQKITTGQILQKNQFRGSDPRNCADTEPFEDGNKTLGIYGELPKTEEIIAWLTTLKLEN